MQFHRRRLWMVIVASLWYMSMLILDAKATHWQASMMELFGIGQLIGILFLVVGSFVWLYARDRKVAFFFLAGSTMMALAFGLETATISIIGRSIWWALADSYAALALLLYALLFLVFPRNSFSSRSKPFLVWGYVVLLTLLAIGSCIHEYFTFALSVVPPVWSFIHTGYDILVVGSILVSVLWSSFSRRTPPRVREQLRILLAGVALAFSPLLLLTILPELFDLPAVYGEYSSLFLILLPMALAYSILRYQLISFDTAIRRAIIWVVICTLSAFLCFVIYLIDTSPLKNSSFAFFISVPFISGVVPFLSIIARNISERIFGETLKAYQVIEKEVHQIPQEQSSSAALVRQLEETAQKILVADSACLLVLNLETGAYHLVPSEEGNRKREALLARVREGLTAREAGATWLARKSTLVRTLEQSRRPHSLGEFVGRAERDVLLAPLFARGEMRAILLLEAKEEPRDPAHLPFAGANQYALRLLLTRFAPALDRRMTQEWQRQSFERFSSLFYRLSTLRPSPSASTGDVVVQCAQIIAEIWQGSVEIWVRTEDGSKLSRVEKIGSGLDWQGSRIVEGRTAVSPPRSLLFKENTAPADDPFSAIPASQSWVWLPLLSREQDEIEAALVLLYPSPRQFSEDEQHLLRQARVLCERLLHQQQRFRALNLMPQQPAQALHEQIQSLLEQVERAIRHEGAPRPAAGRGARSEAISVPVSAGVVSGSHDSSERAHQRFALVVDAHSLERALLVELLRSRGYQHVLAAETTQEAMNLLGAQRFDEGSGPAPVLLDLASVTNPGTFVRQLQEHYRVQWYPILLASQTGNTVARAVRRESTLPATGITIGKPFRNEQVLSCLPKREV
jgi:CheY-like chemotaxis protein